MSITCKSLDHIYGYNTPFEYYALKNVNLKIEKGSFTAIIGQTGSGKSTLIQHINALLLPTSGEIKIDDYIISQNNKPQNLKSLRKKSGLVFQFPEYQLFEETIERDIMFGPMNFGIDENRAKEIAKKVNCYKMMLLTGSKKESTMEFYKSAGYNCSDKTAFVQWIE